jgi:3-oxoacyl-[acyl-carrier-protein] synthase III
MNEQPGVIILGSGSYLPANILNNSSLANRFGVTEDWILSRTGISQRQIASENEATSDLAYHAASEALVRGGLAATDLDAIIVGTMTADYRMPSVACQLQHRLDAGSLLAFDVHAACTGFLTAFQIATAQIKSGACKHILVVGADTASRITDASDQSTAILFGDGAGAVVLAANQGSSHDQRNGDVLATVMGSDGSAVSDLYIPGGGSVDPQGHAKMVMNGKAIFQAAVRRMVTSTKDVLEQASLGVEDVDCWIPHQANQRIIDAASQQLGLSSSQVVSVVRCTGNICAGTLPFALHEAVKSQRLRQGDIAVMTAVGAGLTWGATVLRY